MFVKKRKQQGEEEKIHKSREMETLLPVTLELAEVSKGIYISSKGLKECSTSLNEMSHEVESNIQVNKDMIKQVKHEVEAIHKAAEDIHVHAKQNEVLSGENLRNVEFSINDLNTSIKDIEDVFKYFDQVTKMLERLETYSQSIGDITTYMDQIASKTSLVSINASIEAARAGEAGKGFMVITDAIKGLADQSKTFSTNISGMIQDMTACITDLNQISKMNQEKINNTKESISTLENNLKHIAQSTSELDRNIQGTLASSDKIKHSVVLGMDTVGELTESFDETIKYNEIMNEAVTRQNQMTQQLISINEEVKTISEKQLNMVLDQKMEEKITRLCVKVSKYEGPRDTRTLQQLTHKYLLHSINYINEQGCFEAAANEKSIGFNIFAVEPHYKQFKQSSHENKVYPLSRNLFTGDIIRYAVTKQARTKQLISMGFNLDSLKKINEMTMEELEAL